MAVGLEGMAVVGTVANQLHAAAHVVDSVRTAPALSAEDAAPCAALSQQLEAMKESVERMQSAQPAELDARGAAWARALSLLAGDVLAVERALWRSAFRMSRSRALAASAAEKKLVLKNAAGVGAALRGAEGELAAALSRLRTLDSRQDAGEATSARADSVALRLPGAASAKREDDGVFTADMLRDVLRDPAKTVAALEQLLNLRDKARSSAKMVEILDALRGPGRGGAGPADAQDECGPRLETHTHRSLGVFVDYEIECKKLEELQPRLVKFWRRLERGTRGRRMSDVDRIELASFTRLLWMPWRLDCSTVLSSGYGYIGTGSSAVVMKGELTLTCGKVSVAVKVRRASLSKDESKAAFFLEMSMLHRLRHPAILTFFGAWWPRATSSGSNGDSTSSSDETDSDDDSSSSSETWPKDCAACVFERMDGHVGALVGSGKISSRQDLWSIFIDSAEAVVFLHAQGFAHLAVKPENILARIVRGTCGARLLGRAKLADFAVSMRKRNHFGLDSQWSLHGSKAVSALAYMAPEVLLGSERARRELAGDAEAGRDAPVPMQSEGRDADLLFACDVYSLGITICRLMESQCARSGKRVALPASFHGGEVELTLAARSGTLADDVGRWVNEVLREELELCELVLACVQPRPCDRPPMVAVLVALLRSGPLERRSRSKAGIESPVRLQHMTPASILALGVAYRDGTAVEKDARKAFALISRSASLGNLDAICYLGDIYDDGDGVAKDYAKACELYQRAADGGHMRAVYNLGFMYDNGDGVAQDSAKACELYQRAADGGHMDAVCSLGFMYANGRGVAEDSAKACELYQRAADGGNVGAACSLGVMYASGCGVTKDCVKACALYQRAADDGHIEAVYNLGFMYARGNGVAKDDAKACELYQRAADGGHMDAVCSLGFMYANGRGVAKNSAKARDLFQRAQDGGHTEAATYCRQLERRPKEEPGTRKRPRSPSAGGDHEVRFLDKECRGGHR